MLSSGQSQPVIIITCPHHKKKESCAECAGEKGHIKGACDAVLASVKDRRSNGGTKAVIRAKTISLIEMLVDDLEA